MPNAPDPQLTCEPLRHALQRCAAGEIPANVGLMQIFMAAADGDEAARALRAAIAERERHADHESAVRLKRAVELWASVPDAFAAVVDVLAIERQAANAHARGDASRVAAMFDRVASRSPEASVALYSLGSRDLLDAATREIVARMRDWGCLGPERTLLDLGCGIGRCMEALAVDVAFVVGVDISAEMLKLARSRCAHIANAVFVRSSGRGLSAFADASLDMIYAVDSFPYLEAVDPDLVDFHVADAHRVLKPGGTLLILNFSYRGDAGRDCAEIASLASRHGFVVRRNGTQDFELWDGVTFELMRT